MKKYLLLFFVCLSVQLQAQLVAYDVAYEYAPSIKISGSIQSFLIMNRSIKYADNGEWEKALKNWLNYNNYGSRRTKSKIMLNISTAYEIIGEREKAIVWAKKSMASYERERTKNYLNLLLTQNNILYAGK